MLFDAENSLTITLHTASLAGMSGLIAVGLALLRKLSRLLDVMEDFPPHRHHNGQVLYPKHYSPPKTEYLHDVD